MSDCFFKFRNNHSANIYSFRTNRSEIINYYPEMTNATKTDTSPVRHSPSLAGKWPKMLIKTHYFGNACGPGYPFILLQALRARPVSTAIPIANYCC